MPEEDKLAFRLDPLSLVAPVNWMRNIWNWKGKKPVSFLNNNAEVRNGSRLPEKLLDQVQEMADGNPQSRNVVDQNYQKLLYIRLFAATKSCIEYPELCWDICRAVPVFNVIDKHNNLVPWRGLHQALSHLDGLRKEVRLEGRWSTWETAEPYERQTIGIGREQADWGTTSGEEIANSPDRTPERSPSVLLNIVNNIRWFCNRIGRDSLN